MNVSIIVITKNNIKTIKKCVDGLINLNYDKNDYEIIFVDGHSNDGTDKYIENYINNNIKLIYEDKGTMGYARNQGINEAKGSYIFFIDADAYPEKEWINKVLTHFSENPDLVAVGGMDEMVGGLEMRALTNSWRRLGKSSGVKAITKIKTVNYAIKKQILVTYGMFDESLSHYDESELNARLYSKNNSFGFIFDPSIIVYHERSTTTTMSGIRKGFKNTVIGVPVLLKPHMIKVALHNLSSPIGTSFLLMLVGIALPFIVILLIFMINYIQLIVYSVIALILLMIISYIGVVWIKTRRFAPNLFIYLLDTLIVRSIASSYGFYKYIFKSITIRSNK